MISQERDKIGFHLYNDFFGVFFNSNRKNRFGCEHDSSKQTISSHLTHNTIIYKCMPNTAK